jgi:tetratricopeptide (TPR) repeat protein
VVKKNILIGAKKKEAFALFQSSQWVQAKLLYSQICKLDPMDAEAWFFLGMINGQMGALAEAETCFLRSVENQPNRPEIHYNLARTLESQGYLDRALESYRVAIRLKSDFAAAYTNAGSLCQAQGKLDDALEYQRAAVRLSPELAEAHYNLGNVLKEKGHYAESALHYRNALRIREDFVEAELNLGSVLIYTGQHDNAMESFLKVLSLDPGNVNAVANMARCDAARGDFKAARARLQPFLNTDNPDIGVAVEFAALCRSAEKCDEPIALLERALSRDVSSLGNRDLFARGQFELGRLYDLKNDFERAFKHVQTGNMLQLQIHRCNIQEHIKQVDALIESYNPELMARAPRTRIASQRPVFIVGMPRSGTSLVEQILASHPAVFGAGELSVMKNIASDLPAILASQAPYPRCLSELRQGHVDKMAQRYLAHIEALSLDAIRVIDKMPSNFLELGLINLLFPEAYVIHCVREPLDTCLSCYFQSFGPGLSFTSDLSSLGTYYRQYQRLMDHWNKVLDIALMEVRYEELIADQEGISRALLAFCGLEWDERCLRFYDTERIVNTASNNQVRRPLYKQSMDRWKNYEAYLTPLKEALNYE